VTQTTEPLAPGLQQALASAVDPKELARLFAEERARLREENERHPAGRAACRTVTERTDWLIQRLVGLAVPAGAASERVLGGIAVVATGSYGRRELCAYSDIDVTFMVAEEEDKVLDAAVRQLFLWLMEVFSQRLQLKVGYAYRTLSDLERIDHQSLTALLDARLIAGSHSLFDRFTLALARQIWPASFARLKIAERSEAIARQRETVYLIEPNVRDGCGGLRDIHLAEWLSTVAFPNTRGDVWRQLQRLGAVSRRDGAQLRAARDFLLLVRHWMHFDAGRPADILVRERQEKLAAALGYQDDQEASAVENFMADYYRHTENVARISGFIVERVLGERLSLSDELVCTGSDLAPAYPWVNVTSPAFLVELAEQFQLHGLRPGADLRRTIAEHLEQCSELGEDLEAARRFVVLLRARRGVHETLDLLASLGVLQRWIPELGVAYRRVPYDAVHQHTIGHHSLQVVRSLETLREGDAEELVELRRAWSEVEAPEILFLAALLHDIGKLEREAGHSVSGAKMTRDICGRIGLDPAETARVARLVRHHLLMSETAQLRDLTQDQTIGDFTAAIDTPDLLNMLLLLTYADIEATGVLTPVKVRFLIELHHRAESFLAEERPARPDPERVRKYRSRLSRQLSSANLTAEQVQAHCEGMPVAYLINTPPDRIAAHIRLMASLASAPAAVEFEDDFRADITTLTICAGDTPGLLSRVAGVLYTHEVSVHGAQVFTREGDPPVALDTLWIDFHGRQLPPAKKMEVEHSLLRILAGEPLDDLLDRYRKHLPPPLPPSSVRIDHELAEHHTVLDVDAPDQPGLLFRITRAIASLAWDVHSARISTVGDRARDAFYLTDAGGRRLVDSAPLLEQRFLEAYMAE